MDIPWTQALSSSSERADRRSASVSVSPRYPIRCPSISSPRGVSCTSGRRRLCTSSLRDALPARGSHARCAGQPRARLDGFASFPERSLASVGASPLTPTRPWPGSSTFELPCHLADPLLRPLPYLL